MRRLFAFRWIFVLVAILTSASEPSDPEQNQLALELRTYAPADDWVTPYASNGPFCCPIHQLAVYRETLLAGASSGFWASPNGDSWSVIGRLPPDMLAATEESVYVYVPGNGFSETPDLSRYLPLHSPPGTTVTDLTQLDDILYAVNGSEAVYVYSEQTKIWKRLQTVSRSAIINSISVAGSVLYAASAATGEIYQSNNHGSDWTSAGRLDRSTGSLKHLVVLGDKIFATTERGLFQPGGNEPTWQLAIQGPVGTNLYAVVDFKGKRYAGTDRGLYVWQNGAWILTHAMLSRGPVASLSYGNGIVFASTKNGLFESEDLGRNWKPSAQPLGNAVVINGVVSPANDFAATEKGLFTRADRKNSWSLVPIDNQNSPIASIAATDGGYLVVVLTSNPGANQPGTLYEATDRAGLAFVQLPNLPYSSATARVAVVGDEIFALPDRGAFRLSADKKSWTPEDSLAGRFVYSIVRRGNDSLAALTPESIFLSPESSSGVWTPLHNQIQSAFAAWFDPDHPEVVIAGAGNGLFWSSDIFDPTRIVGHWTPDRPQAFASVLTLCRVPSSSSQPASLLAGTDYGVYLLVDKVHRETALGRNWRRAAQIWDRYSKEPWFWLAATAGSAISAYLFAVLAVLLLAWKGIGRWIGADWLLALVTKPMEFSPRLLRWVLFLGYRKRLMALPEVVTAREHYFGLPAQVPGGTEITPDAEGTALHKTIASSFANTNCLLLQGEGGAGKSTVLAKLASLGALGLLPGVLKTCLPVYVPASFYEGDLIQAISDALKRRDGVPLDRHGDIIRQQLQAGNMLVLFDGVSEIEGDKSKVLARMFALASDEELQESWFVFSTRPVKRLPDGLPVLQLQALKLDIITRIYLPGRSDLDDEQRERVHRQLVSFDSGPIEPLLLSLAINDSLNSTLASKKADLYERYFRRILRVDADSSQLAWEGWRTVLQTFADWFMLDTGRRGFGLVHRVLIRLMWTGTTTGLLRKIEAEYGLTFENELSVLEQLASVGILSSGNRWQFRHDTFEAYFAAGQILDGLQEDGYIDLQIWTGPAERDFLPVIEFIREMGTSKAVETLLTQYPQSRLWRAVLGVGHQGL
jgi:hypothetical protein